MAASSSTAAFSSINQWYQVFLSHRGVDTKETFARSLYLRLLDHGLRAFLDNPEMQPGYGISSQIKNAIRTASVHVAIFSARYAESTWCLDELLEMLESKAPIIPVFYGVTPTEVRWTRGKEGIYAQALEGLAQKIDEGKPRYDPKTIENWRNALSQVAEISGFELKKCDIGDDEENLKLIEVVKAVKFESERKKPDLDVGKFPTGLDAKLKDFEDTVLLPQQPSGRPQRLGIWGLGGVGKTTLAKKIFNTKKSDYPISCFLCDDSDKAAKDSLINSLISLQIKFIKSLTGLDKPIDSVAEGTGMLKKGIMHLHSSNASLQNLDKPIDSLDVGADNVSKILVILDDVHDQSQVDALLPVDLPSGSLIVITSRDKHVLVGSKVKESSIYRLTGLENQYSRELFCSHAFNQTYPLPGFEDLVDKFLEACNGLPLSLKVFGANLYRRSVSYWKEELESFPTEIKERLRISYDALAKQEKQMFLDIACFFTGENRNTVISIWDGSGWKGGRRGFQNLQDKCLVEVDSQNVIHMHDHLKELGRDVADESSPRRLWRWTEEVIEDLSHQPSETVRGIQMYHDEDDVISFTDTENALPQSILRTLRILGTKGECLSRTMELPRILWLHWINCPYSSLPSGISMKKLRFLRVSGSVLNTLWQTEGESQLPVCLEELKAERCVKLKSIAGLAQLTKLRLLSISGCSELKKLPSMEALVCLEELWADGCVKLKRIRGLEQATKLQILSVTGCSNLEELPSMEKLVSLEFFEADRCVKLKRIRGLEQAKKLQKLTVTGCSELEELPSIEALECLEELRADDCVKLKRVRGLEHATKLQTLSVTRCSELEELPSMEALVCLEELWAYDCVKLKRIRGLEQATKLQMLSVNGCSELEELPSMKALVCLEKLWANDCVKLKRIRGLQATKLQKLIVTGCSELEELPSMDALVCLEELWADGCVKLKRIRGLEQAKKLQMLSVTGCSELEELPSMEALVCLEELWANGCVKLKRIRGLEQATKLQILSFTGCSNLEELPSMEKLVSLELFEADKCVKLKRIRGLEQATKLQTLTVKECSELEELPSIEALECLEVLWADDCVKLKRIRGLEQATKLQALSVTRCSELEELPSMDALVCLEALWARGCVKLKRIRGLEQATKLQQLSVRGCSELEEVEGLEHMSLERLNISVCPRLQCQVWG